jgi:cytochrome c biogenesis protein CcmG, thiol:disulfide interchange protein DsbE
MKHYFTWGVLPIVLFGILAVFFWRGLSLDPQNLPSAQLGKALPVFSLKILDEKDFFSPETMRGKPAILHVWASWCATCAEEQVFLLSLAQSGVPMYGLNYKDDPDNARQWLKTWGNPYLLSGRDTEGRVAIDLGVYGTPETFLVDAKGVIRYRHVGALNQAVWERVVLPKWRMLTGEVA